MQSKSSRGGAGVAALGGFIVLVLLVLLALTYKRWEGQPPRLAFDHDFSSLGRTPNLNLTAQDPETGLRHVAIRLKQNGQDVLLADDSFDRSRQEKTKSYDVGKLLVEKYKPQAGTATLTVTAEDYAL